MFSKRVILIALALVCVMAMAASVIVQAQNGQRRQGANPPGMGGGQGQPGQGQFGQRRGLDGPPCPVGVFGPPPAQMMQRLGQELPLTDEQQKQAVSMIGALAERIRLISGDGAPMRELIAELKAETTNADTVKELGAKVSGQEAAILQAELETWLKFEQMLTPEQRAKFWAIFPRQPSPVSLPPAGPGGPVGPPTPPPMPPK